MFSYLLQLRNVKGNPGIGRLPFRFWVDKGGTKDELWMSVYDWED